jgi:hypothetical protein
MSSTRFPLKNIRKNVNGGWAQIHETAEAITVPGSASNYVARLKEVPDNGTINAKPVISGLTLVATYPPTSGCFWVNYATGDIQFNAAEDGQTFSVDYWQRGSLVDVDDINLLYNRVVESDRDPLVTDDIYEVGTSWVNIDTNMLFTCTDNALSGAIWGTASSSQNIDGGTAFSVYGGSIVIDCGGI